MSCFNERLRLAEEIMIDFARSTGLTSNVPRDRYLWTDSFAAFNYAYLYARTKRPLFRDLVILLVDAVHQVLGKYRGDDGRGGWISGLSEEEAREHPTIGGLRIGKRLPERRPDEPYDPILEWERDGQYYHYLTKWMLALCRVFQVMGDVRYLRWSLELAKTAHRAFVYLSPIDKRKHIYWKMSIDLTRPLVFAEGRHDVLDGLSTYLELHLTAKKSPFALPSLESEIYDLYEMCKDKDWSCWATEDPLGIGELLCAAYRLARIHAEGLDTSTIIATALEAAYVSLRALFPKEMIYAPASSRLAFRELGLVIGLRAAERLRELAQDMSTCSQVVQRILRFKALIDGTLEFWLKKENQETLTWLEHRNINMVMLATGLIPSGYLGPLKEGQASVDETI